VKKEREKAGLCNKKQKLPPLTKFVRLQLGEQIVTKFPLFHLDSWIVNFQKMG